MLLRKWEDLPEFMKNEEVRPYYKILTKKKATLICKRILDVIGSIFLIMLLSPVLVIVAVWIKLDSKGPIFYRQERITQYGKTFRIFKFRTMVVNADKIGSLVTSKGDTRITKVGNKIRKYRVDELPQVFNVLLGDMSFVGTRPEVKRYVDEYTDEMKATLLLPAGVTSLASIKYKDEDEVISHYNKEIENIDKIYTERILPQKMKYNIDYISFLSIIKDIWICLKTVI